MSNTKDIKVLKNGYIVTMNENMEIIEGDILIEDGIITGIGKFETSVSNVVNLNGSIVLPGFIQTHIHLCQTIFRGLADDLELLDWLRRRIWPFEAAHTEESLFKSALLGSMELLSGGTTTILTMETVNHTHVVFEALKETGQRAIVGKCLMDEGEGVPKPLKQGRRKAMNEVEKLYKKYHNSENGRLQLAVAPRFALSCSDKLIEDVRDFCQKNRVIIHSHSSENLKEIESVYEVKGMRNIEYFHKMGLTGDILYLAHCIWVDEDEMNILSETKTRVLHCPGSNLKLGSGIAMIPEMLERGISVSLGADGAPCNNNLDVFMEMRLAGLIQSIRKGPGFLKSEDIVKMATIDAARALRMDDKIGSIELGKRADIVVLRRKDIHSFPYSNIYSALVYNFGSRDVVMTMVDGKLVYENGLFPSLNRETVLYECEIELKKLLERARRYEK